MAAGNAQGGRWLLTASIAFNGLFLGVLLVLGAMVWLSEPLWAGLFPRAELAEIVRQESGSGREKVAIIRVEGVLAEGLLGYVHRQIEQAAADKGVQAVVLRVNSPGGTITSSDDLHRRLTTLISGDPAKKRDPKPLVASFGSLAASGGYYISAPAATIVCDRSGLTGSIGVFAGLPSIEGFSKQHGVGMTVIKQGEIKDSGSMFRSMTPKERQVWQDLIDTSYNRFVAVVEEGRGKRLKRKLLEPFPVAPVRAGPNPPEVMPYQRYLADGGIYTAEKALEHGLVDSLGTLDDAVAEARRLADLDEHCKVVEYDRPRAPAELALGVRLPAALSAAFGPRLWALAPGHEAEAWLALAEAGAR
jgi:protease-4